MALKFPDILEHNNSNLPLVDIIEIKGNSFPLGTLDETGSIPSAKRNIGTIVFISSSQEYYGFYGQDSSSISWDDEENWRPLGGGGDTFQITSSPLGNTTASVQDGGDVFTVNHDNQEFLTINSDGLTTVDSLDVINGASGSFSGSFEGDGSGLTNINTSAITSSPLGNTTASVQDGGDVFAVTHNTLEFLTINDSGLTTVNSLIVTDDLTVIGTASFQNTENLLVADRFVLFASGSNTTGDGGIVVQQDTQDFGELYGFNEGAERWGFKGNFDATLSTYTPEAFVAAVIDIGAGQLDDIKYQKNGNIKIDNGDIFIYS
jgi:hypothetical protein